jgi:CubicO group peptidase (beta-lactamase class C family)
VLSARTRRVTGSTVGTLLREEIAGPLGADVHIGLPEAGPGQATFGHFGAGGSLGFADPESGVSFGYVMNQMGPRWQNPRTLALVDAVYACL